MALPIHFVVDPQGWCCVGVIVCIWLYNTLFVPKLILFPRFQEGHVPAAAIWNKELWELCNKCNLMRPKRSHHCSRCGHCVRKMDHHCPWINNCVGEDNHWLFLQLCFYTQLLSAYTLLLDFCHYYYFLPLKNMNWDTTTIEKMSNCCEEISRARKPWQQTFSEVFGTRWKILWFIPFRRRRPLRVSYYFANHV
ncbi:hypothetical protein FKM82_000541 [Ascaphus truei]